MSAFKSKTMLGYEIPRKARYLTRGDGGVMRDWYDRERQRMIATVLYKRGEMVGWCAAVQCKFLWFKSRKFKISTFVHRDVRGKGYGKKLLKETLKSIKSIEPKAKVLYGTPEDHDYFNKTYERAIVLHGFKAVRFYAA